MDVKKLTILDIKNLLFENYGLNLVSTQKISHCSTDCYIIECTDKKYFIKIFDRDDDIKKIVREYGILENLRKVGFMVPNIICTKNSEIYAIFDGHSVFVENFIEGYSYINTSFPQETLLESATLLGKIHRSLVGKYEDPTKEDYWTKLDLEPEYNYLNSILEKLENCKDDKNYEKIKNIINHKKVLLNELKRLNSILNGLTYTMTHGDYSKRNIICNNKKIVGIVDFSESGVYPAAWELIRSYFFSTESLIDNDKFDFDLFSLYIKKYLDEFDLTSKDIELMPYLFMYQIVISKYGYKEYLETKNEKFLNFIRWKDDITCFLEDNADYLVKRIQY